MYNNNVQTNQTVVSVFSTIPKVPIVEKKHSSSANDLSAVQTVWQLQYIRQGPSGFECVPLRQMFLLWCFSLCRGLSVEDVGCHVPALVFSSLDTLLFIMRLWHHHKGNHTCLINVRLISEIADVWLLFAAFGPWCGEINNAAGFRTNTPTISWQSAAPLLP